VAVPALLTIDGVVYAIQLIMDIAGNSKIIYLAMHSIS
jgi:hypothetical protein